MYAYMYIFIFVYICTQTRSLACTDTDTHIHRHTHSHVIQTQTQAQTETHGIVTNTHTFPRTHILRGLRGIRARLPHAYVRICAWSANVCALWVEVNTAHRICMLEDFHRSWAPIPFNLHRWDSERDRRAGVWRDSLWKRYCVCACKTDENTHNRCCVNNKRYMRCTAMLHINTPAKCAQWNRRNLR